MTRKDFLEKVGIGAAFVLTSACLGSCGTDTSIGPIDLELDLTDAANSALQNNGGYVVIDNQVVVARDNDGELVAATRICSHEQQREIILRDNEWYCTDHGARFTLSGSGLNENGRRNLTIFNTQLNGNILRVFS